MRNSRTGFTLLEVLICLLLLGVVFALLLRLMGSTTANSSDLQNRMNATDSARRVLELVTQEIRSSAFGIMANVPYAPGATQVSLLRPTASAGNTVAGLGVINTTNFTTAQSLNVYAGSVATIQNGSYFVLAGGGAARLMKTTSAATGTTTQTLTHTGCPNTLAANAATVTMVTPVGFRFNSTNNILYEKRGSAAEAALAWNVSNFNVGYIYSNSTNTTESSFSDYPGPTRTVSGVTWNIRRLSISVSMNENGKTQTVSTIVNLSSPIGFNINSYTECGT